MTSERPMSEAVKRLETSAIRWLAFVSRRTQGKPIAYQTEELERALRAWLEERGKTL